MQFLLAGDCHLPLKGGNIAVLVLYLVAFKVLINLFKIEIKLNTEFADLF
jgi:hypothetical protein